MECHKEQVCTYFLCGKSIEVVDRLLIRSAGSRRGVRCLGSGSQEECTRLVLLMRTFYCRWPRITTRMHTIDPTYANFLRISDSRMELSAPRDGLRWRHTKN